MDVHSIFVSISVHLLSWAMGHAAAVMHIVANVVNVSHNLHSQPLITRVYDVQKKSLKEKWQIVWDFVVMKMKLVQKKMILQILMQHLPINVMRMKNNL